jgi:hypothetical protein
LCHHHRRLVRHLSLRNKKKKKSKTKIIGNLFFEMKGKTKTLNLEEDRDGHAPLALWGHFAGGPREHRIFVADCDGICN